MMTKLPDCPRCLEDELWLIRSDDEFRIRCYACGYDSGWKKPREDMDLEGSIAMVVHAAHVAAVFDVCPPLRSEDDEGSAGKASKVNDALASKGAM